MTGIITKSIDSEQNINVELNRIYLLIFLGVIGYFVTHSLNIIFCIAPTFGIVLVICNYLLIERSLLNKQKMYISYGFGDTDIIDKTYRTLIKKKTFIEGLIYLFLYITLVCFMFQYNQFFIKHAWVVLFINIVMWVVLMLVLKYFLFNEKHLSEGLMLSLISNQKQMEVRQQQQYIKDLLDDLKKIENDMAYIIEKNITIKDRDIIVSAGFRKLQNIMEKLANIDNELSNIL